MAKSSSNTRTRRSVGLSGEKELQRSGRSGMRVRKTTSFDIASRALGFRSSQSESRREASGLHFNYWVGVIS